MAPLHPLLARLGLDHPIVQAPMVGVSTPALAAAVANAGGLGAIGLGASTAAQGEALIAQTRALTSRAFNVNLFCHVPAQHDPAREAAWLAHLAPWFAEVGATPPTALHTGYRSFLESPDVLEMLLRTRPAVASFHFGLPPQDWIAALRATGIVTLACVVSPHEARLAEAAGVDALVAQGHEAGGHRGTFEPAHDPRIGTFALVQTVRRASALPVIAAGGIMDGRGIAACLQLGAIAAQMGTAFVLTPESSANAAYRAALQSEQAFHTEVTDRISGRPARGLVTRWHTDIALPAGLRLPDYPITYDAAKALIAAAVAQGQAGWSVQWAGQGAPLARALPASELMAALVKELRDALPG